MIALSEDAKTLLRYLQGDGTRLEGDFVPVGKLDALFETPEQRVAAVSELARWGYILAPAPNGAVAPSAAGLRQQV